MPELPEVETIKNGLKTKIIHKQIENIHLYLPKLIQKPLHFRFIQRVTGAKIQQISRRGKYIIFYLDTTDHLIVHLGMSGVLLYLSDDTITCPVNIKYNHLIFYLNDGSQVIYNDIRQFGKIWLLRENETLDRIEDLGIEPLGSRFTLEKLWGMLNHHKGKIKSLLMNQRYIAGIGNIYANEILFHAGINPTRQSCSLQFSEVEKLFSQIKDILNRAINSGGTTIIDETYRNSLGKKGRYGKKIQIYGKRKEKCPVCGHLIKVIKIENRSTFICPDCQK